MAIYAISDLHLSTATDKPMDVFGPAWEDYENRIISGFSSLKEDDVTIIPGDVSWSMSLNGALSDFQFIDRLPGRKIISKGNHDYWWDTVKKTTRLFSENSISTIDILHNNAFLIGDTAICGTRGWFYEIEDGKTSKIYEREICRLRHSLEEAKKLPSKRLLCFLHYPPICNGYECAEITDMLESFGVDSCYYGHLHAQGHKSAFIGVHKNVEYNLISADYLGFKPVLIG